MCNTSHITSSRLSNKPGYIIMIGTLIQHYTPDYQLLEEQTTVILTSLTYWSIYMMSYFFQVNNYPVSNHDLSLPPLPCTKMPAYISVYSVNYFLTISMVYLSNLSNKNTPISLECVCSTTLSHLYTHYVYFWG